MVLAGVKIGTCTCLRVLSVGGDMSVCHSSYSVIILCSNYRLERGKSGAWWDGVGISLVGWTAIGFSRGWGVRETSIIS